MSTTSFHTDVVPKLAKLVCTLGPASVDRVDELIEAGMDIARVNLSHGAPADHEHAVRAVREAASSAGRTVGVLLDLSGPKVRLGELRGGSAQLQSGATFELRAEASEGDATGAATTFPQLVASLEPGDHVLLADGAAELRVLEAGSQSALTEVTRGGTVRSRAGVNVPSARLPLGPLTEKDREDLQRALEWDVDFVAQSFVRTAADVEELRGLIGGPHPRVMAKIETDAAVDAFDDICAAADAIMLARGDLGVEIPFAELPVIQKSIVGRSAAAGTPIIVATHMLESMVASRLPTRAEASDVANAVLDGADGVLLSAETAIGAHPVDAASTAVRLISAAERRGAAYLQKHDRTPSRSGPEAVARAASALADEHSEVAAILCFTRTGRTAALLSAARPRVPILAFSPDPHVCRACSVYRSVLPFGSELPQDTDSMVEMMDSLARSRYGFAPGTLVVVVASTPVGTAHTNLLKLHPMGGPRA